MTEHAAILEKHGYMITGTTAVLAVLVTALLTQPAKATTVEWTGAIANTCVVTLGNHGTLGIATDGQTLSSEHTAGLPARVTVMSTSTNVVTFSNPAMTLWSPSYTGTPAIATRHSSNKGHSGTWQQNQHQATVVAGDTLFELHAQATDPGTVFPMGAYKVTSEVTCAPAS